MSTIRFRRFTFPVSFACALSLAAVVASTAKDAPADAADEVLLDARFLPGKTYTFRQVMESEMALPLGGEGKAVTTLDYTMILAVGPADKLGHKQVAVSMGAFKMKMDVGAAVVEYDSTDPDKQNPLLKGMMGDMADGEFTAEFDGNDELVAPKDGEKDAAAGEAGGGKPGMMGMMGVEMGEAQLREMVASMTDYGFPDDPVSPGESWTQRIDSGTSPMGSFAMALKHTYVGMTDYEGEPCAMLTVTGGKAEPAEGEDAGEDAGAALVDIKSVEVTGTVMFDVALGVARHSETKMEMTMSAGGAELPVSSNVSSSLLKIEPTKPAK